MNQGPDSHLPETSGETEQRALFRQGWNIVGFTATVQFFSVGIGYYTFGVYLKPLAEALDENRFWVSLALSMQTILMAALSPLAGRIVSEYSIKAAMAAGVCLMSAGLVICSMATNIISFGPR